MASKPKKDAGRGLRLNKIIDYINKRTPYGGVTLKELAEKHEVTERQIRRDLDAIQNDLKLPLIRKEQVVDGRKCTLYCFEAGYLPSLSPEKATAIFLSLLQQQGSALAGHLNDLKDALVSTLFKYHYDPRELAVEKLQNRIHIVEEALAEPGRVGELFTRLVGALKDCHRVKIWYYVAYSGQVTERVVEPYGLICKRQNWYLVAYCLKRRAIRVFRVDQIQDAFPYTSQKFEYPEEFNLKEHMARSWGVINDGAVCRVRLKFNHNVAFRIRSVIYHPSQVLEEELTDGSIIVSFNVCGIAEMKTWIVQWGDAVEVLEPDWLREEMYKLAESILNVYRPR
jgi:proteasome accessory factor B